MEYVKSALLHFMLTVYMKSKLKLKSNSFLTNMSQYWSKIGRNLHRVDKVGNKHFL